MSADTATGKGPEASIMLSTITTPLSEPLVSKTQAGKK